MSESLFHRRRDATTPATSCGRGTVLLVASGPWDEVVSVAELVRDRLARGADILWVSSPRQLLLREYLATMAVAQHFETSPTLFNVLRETMRLKRQPHDLTVVLWTGKRWHRRLKVLGFLAGIPRLLVINENLDYFYLNLGSVTIHLAWRLRERWSRWRLLGGAALRLLRTQGAVATWRHARRRWRGTGRVKALVQARLGMVRRPALAVSDDKPLVSIVIPAHNQWGFTRRCLQSIARFTRGNYEVILVDADSADATRTAAPKVKGLRVVRLIDNPGFVDACNAGAEAARGTFVMFLNNDVVVTEGWLESLLEIFAWRTDCGAVGAKLLYPSGTLQEAGAIVWQDGRGWNYGKYDDPERPEYNYVRQVDYCSGAALMVRRDDLQAIGGFDRAFAPGYWEDADLCFTLRRRGRTVWFQPASRLYHFEGASSGTDTSSGMKRFQVINQAKFRDKWGSELGGQYPFEPRILFRARDRNPGPVVLVFDHYVPTFDRDAGSSFMDQFLRVLYDLGHRVILWPDNLFRTPGYSERLLQYGIEIVYGTTKIEEYLASFSEFLDFAIAYRAPIAAKYLPLVKGRIPAVAYIAVDLEHVREQRRMAMESDDLVEVGALKDREQTILSFADRVGVHSPVEARILREELRFPEIYELPLPVTEVELGARGFDDRQDLVFVGSTHPPNSDAIHHFTSRVFPHVRHAVPGVRLLVIGEVCDSVRDLAGCAGVELVGFVRDLSEWLHRARVFVAPLRYGAGVKGKVLEAMNHGVPVVTTSVGAEGIALEHRSSVLIGDSDADFAKQVVVLYTDREMWRSVRDRARSLIEQEYSSAAFRRKVASFAESLAAVASSSRQREGPG